MRDFVATGPLVLFFLLAGVELRSEIVGGSLTAKKSYLIPFAAAIGGMAVPALLYFVLAKVFGVTTSAWGVPMATDLPLVLLALVIFPKSISSRIRGFLLALAIGDDIGSILVVAVAFHQDTNFLSIFISAVFVGIFWLLAPKVPKAAAFIALISWFIFKSSGIHPTVIGVALGLCLNHEESTWLVRKLTPVVNYLIVPLFILTTLWRPWNVDFSSNSLAIISVLVIARMVGKPVGIILVGLAAMKISKNGLISPKDLSLVGFLATIGLSVSLLFADLSNLGSDLSAVLLGVLLTIPVAFSGLLVFRTQVRNQEY